MFGSKRTTQAFLSYRNIYKNNTYINYELVKMLNTNLCNEDGIKRCFTIPPESIPSETIFSAYSAAEFIHKTFKIIDDPNHFIILANDYFDENNIATSIWAEAELIIWSYYDRDMWLSPYRKKNKYYLIATLNKKTELFEYKRMELMELDNYSRALFRRAALDFEKGHFIPAPHFNKAANYYIISCNGCGDNRKIKSDTIRRFIKLNLPYRCECGNTITFSIVDKYFVGSQELIRTKRNISILMILELLLGNESFFNTIEF